MVLACGRAGTAEREVVDHPNDANMCPCYLYWHSNHHWECAHSKRTMTGSGPRVRETVRQERARLLWSGLVLSGLAWDICGRYGHRLAAECANSYHTHTHRRTIYSLAVAIFTSLICGSPPGLGVSPDRARGPAAARRRPSAIIARAGPGRRVNGPGASVALPHTSAAPMGARLAAGGRTRPRRYANSGPSGRGARQQSAQTLEQVRRAGRCARLAGWWARGPAAGADGRRRARRAPSERQLGAHGADARLRASAQTISQRCWPRWRPRAPAAHTAEPTWRFLALLRLTAQANGSTGERRPPGPAARRHCELCVMTLT